MIQYINSCYICIVIYNRLRSFLLLTYFTYYCAHFIFKFIWNVIDNSYLSISPPYPLSILGNSFSCFQHIVLQSLVYASENNRCWNQPFSFIYIVQFNTIFVAVTFYIHCMSTNWPLRISLPHQHTTPLKSKNCIILLLKWSTRGCDLERQSTLGCGRFWWWISGAFIF